jgi:hypothetical protein
MASLRRGLLSRFSSTSRSRDLPLTIDRMDRMSIADDSSSIRTVLPAYPYNSETQHRPPSPAPTYQTIDQIQSSHSVQPVVPPLPQKGIDKQAIIEELVNRVRDSLYNPKAWRLHNDGRKSFFWALRCVPGTADVLQDSIQEIRENVVGGRDWQVDKFCFIFKGQKLGDLWCRPIDPAVSLDCIGTNRKEIWDA